MSGVHTSHATASFALQSSTGTCKHLRGFTTRSEHWSVALTFLAIGEA
ncbi:hypothetical protein VTO73DRAFT_15413 [Trametes versicolor]